jgi:hypothetical protein
MRKSLIFLIAAAFLAVSVIPATAQDDGSVSIAGNVNMETYWISTDSTRAAATGNGTNSYTDLNWTVSGPGTFIDFRWKQGDIGGRFVLRPQFGSNSHAYGTWNFGAGTLLVGFGPDLTNIPAGLQMRGGNSSYDGTMDFQSRKMQLSAAFPVGGGTLSVGLMEPGEGSLVVTTGSDGRTPTDRIDVVLPMLQANYNVKFGGSNLKIAGAYQTYDEVDAGTDRDYSIDTWVIGLYYSIGFGPITANANIYTGKNMYAYDFGGDSVGAAYDSASDSVKDSTTTGWHISAGWKISDMLTLQAGYGAMTSERDQLAGETTKPEDSANNYYINMPIFAAKNFTITPGIGVRDDDDSTSGSGSVTPEGKETHYGVKWVIRF